MQIPCPCHQGTDCFHALEGLDCLDTDIFLQMHSLGIDREEHHHRVHDVWEAEWSQVSLDGGEADSFFGAYYRWQSTADLATRYLHQDLDRFGYKHLDVIDEQPEEEA